VRFRDPQYFGTILVMGDIILFFLNSFCMIILTIFLHLEHLLSSNTHLNVIFKMLIILDTVKFSKSKNKYILYKFV